MKIEFFDFTWFTIRLLEFYRKAGGRKINILAGLIYLAFFVRKCNPEILRDVVLKRRVEMSEPAMLIEVLVPGVGAAENNFAEKIRNWPAPGSVDTHLS